MVTSAIATLPPARSTAPTAAAPATFSTDVSDQDPLGRAAAADLLAELAVHRGTETPLAIGILGAAGSGKSAFLRRLGAKAALLGAAAADGASPYATETVVARVDALPGADPATLIAGGVLDALAGRHAALAEDAIYAGSDPREAVRLAGERLADLRRKLDDERRLLDEVGARRARLTETVLFDTAGTRLDAYARAKRGRIEARLQAFGLLAADPLKTYKGLVRQAGEPAGAATRIGFALRSLWAYKGQGSLLLLALLLGLLGWAADLGASRQAELSAWIGGTADRLGAVADWERAHLDWLPFLGRAGWTLGAAALVILVLRAVAFVLPVFRGGRLLAADLAERRRDLDSLLAHQTRRVEQVAAEAEAAGKGAEAAERRAGGVNGGLSVHGAALAGELFGRERGSGSAAASLLGHLSRAVTAGSAGPRRLVIAIDGLDRLAPPAAADVLETAQRLLARPGFVMVVALDRPSMMAALGETDPALASARLSRAVQITYDLDAAPLDPHALAEALLRPAPADEAPVDAGRTALDRPLQPREGDVVRALAPFAGRTPRAVKRFVNAYRVARADPRLRQPSPATLTCLAVALALDGGEGAAELAAFGQDLTGGRIAMNGDTEIGRAFGAARSAAPGDIAVPDARLGFAVARSYGRS